MSSCSPLFFWYTAPHTSSHKHQSRRLWSRWSWQYKLLRNFLWILIGCLILLKLFLINSLEDSFESFFISQIMFSSSLWSRSRHFHQSWFRNFSTQKIIFPTHPNFILLKSQDMKDYDLSIGLYSHKKSGGQLLSIQSLTDENKVFGITFRTPSDNSTGIAHVLEHSVLCGSRKYQSKEPFADLLKGSLNTFLNAFTYPDRTCYPVASMNTKDFYNLVDVYLDAVFCKPPPFSYPPHSLISFPPPHPLCLSLPLPLPPSPSIPPLRPSSNQRPSSPPTRGVAL
jgi:hypothetical protein